MDQIEQNQAIHRTDAVILSNSTALRAFHFRGNCHYEERSDVAIPLHSRRLHHGVYTEQSECVRSDSFLRAVAKRRRRISNHILSQRHFVPSQVQSLH